MSDICAVCQFCTYEVYGDGECYCHNEQSQNYGKLLKHADTEKPACDDFSPSIYRDLSLKDALRILTTETTGCTPFYNLPDAEYRPFLCENFKDNKQMADWRDAKIRLFIEYMDMAKKDGDFTDESQET